MKEDITTDWHFIFFLLPLTSWEEAKSERFFDYVLQWRRSQLGLEKSMKPQPSK